MATVAELARLRDMISEPDLADGWTDDRLEAILVRTANSNGTVNLRAAAADVWEAKAAEASELVDVTESSSSRRQSQYFDHALKMAAQYGSSATDPTNTTGRPRSVAMRRPTRG
jgi:hypothetical protein